MSKAQLNRWQLNQSVQDLESIMDFFIEFLHGFTESTNSFWILQEKFIETWCFQPETSKIVLVLIFVQF